MTAIWALNVGQRWRGALIIVVALWAILLLGVGTVQRLHGDVYAYLPEELLALAGIPSNADPAVMGYSQMLGFLGALTVAGYAVAVGAQLIAAEERTRTLPLVLSCPVSRTSTASAKAGSLTVIIGLICVALWGAAELTAMALGLELGAADLAGLCLALGANALLCGAFAFTIGAVTGNRGIAIGIGSLIVTLGWLLAALLPMSPKTQELAHWVPWSWYSQPQVLVNGLDSGKLGLQLTLSVALLTLGIISFRLRDLRQVRLTARIRQHTWLTSSATGPLRVALTRHSGLLLILAVTMFGVMGALMGPIYQQLQPNLVSMNAALPPELLQLWGAADLSTPAGFYWGETMGLVAPAAVIIAGTAIAGALGSDEISGRLGLVLAARGGRSRILAEAIAAQGIVVGLIAALTGLGIWVGSGWVQMSLPEAHIAGAALHLAALGLLVSAGALLAVAISGSPATAAWAAVGISLAGYVTYSALPMHPELAAWARLSPFYYYASAQPLASGAHWGHIAVLLTLTVVLWAACVPLFARRDLRR